MKSEPGIKRPQNAYAKYHGHVYFDATSLEQAQRLCADAASRFAAQMGRVHRKRVGPHPRWSCQLAFDATQFDALIAWLEENRNGLTILVHAVTGNDLEDHTAHASWLGAPAELDLAIFGG